MQGVQVAGVVLRVGAGAGVQVRIEDAAAAPRCGAEEEHRESRLAHGGELPAHADAIREDLRTPHREVIVVAGR